MQAEEKAAATDVTGASAAGGFVMRSAFLLMLRQGLVSLATLAGVLTLSGLLSPSQFALYGYATTVMLVAAAVGDLGLGAGLIRSDSPRAEHIRGSFALQLAFWIPICLFGIAVGSVVEIYGFSPTTTALLFAALTLLSLQALPTSLLERSMKFGAIATVEVTQRILFVVVAVVFAAVNPAQWSIPLATLAAAAVSYPTILIISKWRWWPKFHRGEPLFRGFSSNWWQSRLANQLSYAAYPLLGGILFTGREVGLMVWALAVTSIPALMSPMVARAAFPAMARTAVDHRIAVFRPLLKGLLLVGLPIVAVLFSCAHPLTEYILGTKWLDGVPLLQLESMTTLLGLVLTTIVPLLFLITSARKVKRIMVGWTTAVIVMSPLLALLVSYRAISIAQLLAGTVVLLLVERLLRGRHSYSVLGDMWPGLGGLIVAIAIGLPLASKAGGAAETLAVAALIAVIQLLVTILLGGGVDARALIKRFGSEPYAVRRDSDGEADETFDAPGAAAPSGAPE